MRFFSILLLAAMVLSLLPALASPARAGCISYGDYLHPLGSYLSPGFPREIAYQEPYLFVVDGLGSLIVVDASDPAFLEEVASIALPAQARGMVVANSIAYCALENDVLQLVDLSDPHAPALLGSTALPCTPTSVAVAGAYAYVPAWEYCVDNHGIYAVDVSDPLAPAVVSRTEVEPYPTNIAISGGYAYTLDSFGLSILDLSSPAAPVRVGNLNLPGGGRYLTVRGDRTYVVCSGEEYPAPDNGLNIIDTSDPTEPQVIGTLTAEDAPAFGIGLWGDYALIGHGSLGMALIDISVPQDPKIVHHVGIQGVPSDYIVTDSLLFARSHMVMSYLLQEPFAPEPGAVVPGIEGIVSTATDGHYAYVVEYENARLHVLDLSDPEDPRIIGSAEIDADFAYGIAITDPGILKPHAYIGGRRIGSEIYVVDISDPSAPRHVNTLSVLDSPSDLDVEGNYLYAPCGYGELSVFDISSPAAPQLLSSLDFTYNVQVVKAVGTTLYVGQRLLNHYGLYVVDASDPYNLGIISQSTDPRCPYEFWLEGSLLYIADGDRGFLIMDVSDAQWPVTLGRLTTLPHAESVIVDGDVAYVADSQTNSGVQAIDVSDPSAPFVIGYFPADQPSELELVQGHALMATQHGPHSVIPLECGAAAAPEVIEAGALPVRLSLSSSPGLGGVAFLLELPRATTAQFDLHDVQGRRLRRLHSGWLSAGAQQIVWNGRDDHGDPAAAGVYFYRLETAGESRSGRLSLIR
jgi:hypothetical protein